MIGGIVGTVTVYEQGEAVESGGGGEAGWELRGFKIISCDIIIRADRNSNSRDQIMKYQILAWI